MTTGAIITITIISTFLFFLILLGVCIAIMPQVQKLFIRQKFKKFYEPVREQELKLIRAFDYGGKEYWTLPNVFEMATGRALMALTYYDEFSMRCDREYLKLHCEAMDILINNPKKISIGVIAQIHENLKDRVNLIPFPDHIYKLASVLFMDENETLDTYDIEYNKKKIAAWRADPELLPFLVSQPMKQLMPFSLPAGDNLVTYSPTMAKIDEMKTAALRKIISENAQKN